MSRVIGSIQTFLVYHYISIGYMFLRNSLFQGLKASFEMCYYKKVDVSF
jgi:hypothetical protein